MKAEKHASTASSPQPASAVSEPHLFGDVMSRPMRRHAELPACTMGMLVALADDGRVPLVTFSGQSSAHALRARAMLPLGREHIGRPVALVFEDGREDRPVVLGVVHDPDRGTVHNDMPAGGVEVDADGARMVVAATAELVLRCGKSSVTLCADGRVEIKGESIVSEATGPNRVRGGAVLLN